MCKCNSSDVFLSDACRRHRALAAGIFKRVMRQMSLRADMTNSLRRLTGRPELRYGQFREYERLRSAARGEGER